MIMKKYFALILASIALCFTSCEKDKEKVYSIFTQLDQIKYDAEDEYTQQSLAAKTYLVNEEFIYWEDGDEIKIHDGTKAVDATLISGAGTKNAYFEIADGINKPDGSTKPYRAIYPKEAYAGPTSLIFPSEMPYRTSGPNADFTFDKNCFPMYSYWDANASANHQAQSNPDLNDCFFFHAVAGVARVQFWAANSVGNDKTITSIEFESFPADPANRQRLSGTFDVQDNTKNYPWLQNTTTPTAGDASTKITITGINQKLTPGGGGQNGLMTFYLPLPAQAATIGSGYDRPNDNTGSGVSQNYTPYRIKVKVIAEGGYFAECIMNVKIRREAITMVPALMIKQWTQTSQQDGNVDVGLVGNGTSLRPFEIYNDKDLIKARNAMNAKYGTINGQAITENTYFKVARTDIVLTDDNWTSGFRDFKGHFRCSSGSPVAAGITNNSTHPLFESISTLGTVDSVTVRSSVSKVEYEGSMSNPFSPLCITNNGKMNNCVNQVNVETKYAGLAGICVTNNGTIHGCRNEGNLTKSRYAEGEINIAGICLTNNSDKLIIASSTITKAQLAGTNVAGICNTNRGTVQDCNTIISRTSQTSNWGCIVYTNYGDVKNCYAWGVLSTSGKIGGIVADNRGNILGCRNQMTTLIGTGYVGGIAAGMTAGEIRNCFQDGFGAITSQATGMTYVGGLVGMLDGGVISNSYSTFQCSLGHSEANGSKIGGVVGYAYAGEFHNVYCYDGVSKVFFGTAVAGKVSLDNCFSYSAQTIPATTKATPAYSTTPIRRPEKTVNENLKGVIYIKDDNLDHLTGSSDDAYIGTLTTLVSQLESWRESKNDAKYYKWKQNVGSGYSEVSPYLDGTRSVDPTPTAKKKRK